MMEYFFIFNPHPFLSMLVYYLIGYWCYWVIPKLDAYENNLYIIKYMEKNKIKVNL